MISVTLYTYGLKKNFNFLFASVIALTPTENYQVFNYFKIFIGIPPPKKPPALLNLQQKFFKNKSSSKIYKRTTK